MRTTMLAISIALALGVPPAFADPQIIIVEEATPASGATSVPEPPALSQNTEPGTTQPPAAQDNAPVGPPSRFSFRRVEDGFLRLDTQTGQVTLCSAHAVGWACQAVPEDRAALEQEMDRLREQVERMKQEIATLRASPTPPPRPPGDLTPKSDQGGGLKMPTDEDIARARAAVENAWRRLMEMMKTLQDDMTRKN
ncbi:MAG TPA: hypothetical protein VI251_18810 [Pseudolabrys sp.]|jgi:hypothetical protein